MDTLLRKNEIKTNTGVQQNFPSDNVYKYLLYFDWLYDKFTDKGKKEFLGSFISCIEIYPDRVSVGTTKQQSKQPHF